jgi:hypothetical protein
MKKLRWLLAFINFSLGKRPVTAITAQEVLTCAVHAVRYSATPSPRPVPSVTWRQTCGAH